MDAYSREVELLEAWRAGDAEAGNALVVTLFPMVYRFFASKLDRGLEDLAQQTFETCVHSRDQIPAHGGLRAWVISVARNQLLHELRRRHRHDARFDPIETTVRGALGSPSALVAERESAAGIRVAMQSIPIDFQTTLELYYVEEMDVAEIAFATGVPPGTVRSRLHRGRRLLAEELRSVGIARGIDDDGSLAARIRATRVEPDAT
ncbi:MAG: sigma-70 family RNA polymerase sigma factor [Deltaproteobacteria bacterium]|nr:sigma-70 family RNA polymerase sigma factor [Deltaproteobacteria bacterium]